MMALSLPRTRGVHGRHGPVALVGLLIAALVVVPDDAVAVQGDVVSTTGYPVTVLDLGPDGLSGNARGAAAGGEIVGVVSLPDDAGGFPQARTARWSSPSTTPVLVDVGTDLANAGDVNPSGTVVGNRTVVSSVRYSSPFALDADNAFTDLRPTDAMATNASAVGLDRAGWAAGTYFSTNRSGTQGWVAPPGQRGQLLPRAPFVDAIGTNVVTDIGSGYVTGNAGGTDGRIPFLYDYLADSWTQPFTPSGTGLIRAISDGGTAEGEWFVGTEGASGEVLLWSVAAPGATPTVLPADPGGGVVVPAGVSSGPTPVVVGQVIAGAAPDYAFAWRADIGLVNLGTLGGDTSLAEAVIGTRVVGRAETPAGSWPVAWDLAPLAAPRASILAPTDGVEFADDTIPAFAGTAADPADGNLTGTSLQWSSDRDGVLGAGQLIDPGLSPGEHQITLTATNSAGSAFTDSITVTVIDSTTQPPEVSIFSPSDAATFAQGETISFSGAASDPQDGFVSSSLDWTSDLDGPFREGAFFTISTLSAGEHAITATATDSDGNTGSASITITIEPSGNQPPVIDPIAAQVVDELTQLRVPVVASDPDGDVVELSLQTPPSGMSLSGSEVVWAPTEAQGPGAYSITVVASDGLAEVSETLEVTVNEVNQPPVIDPIAAQEVDAGTELTFTVTATDPDVPTDTIAWDLDGAAPSGAAIDAATGTFSWTPGAADVGTATFGIIASDGTASSTETVTVTVNEPPLETISISISERVGVRDQAVVLLPVEIFIAERVGVRDEAAVLPPVVISISEEVGVRDGVAILPPVEIFIAERVGVREEAGVLLPVEIYIAERVGVSDDVPFRLAVEIAVTEVIGVGDEVTITTVEEGIVSSDTLLPGETYDFSGNGFGPNSDINIGLESDFFLLTTTTADGNGDFDLTITLPSADELPEGFAGQHRLVAKGTNLQGLPHEAAVDVTVAAPIAVDLHPDNPSAIIVGELHPVLLTATLTRIHTGLTDATPDWADLTIYLEPIGPGRTVEGDRCAPESGPVEQPTAVTCEFTFTDADVNSYTVVAVLDGGSFYGRDEATITIADPRRGSVNGDGSFGWPGSSDTAAFALSGRYPASGRGPVGTFVLEREHADGSVHRLQSTNLAGVAIDRQRGWATMSGTADYSASGMRGSTGGHTFVVYVVDDPGGDRIWVEVRDQDGDVVDDLSIPAPAQEIAVVTDSGNIHLGNAPAPGHGRGRIR